MSIAAAFLLAATAVQTAPSEAPLAAGHGAQVETAQVTVRILRAAVLKGGDMLPGAPDLPKARRHLEPGRVAYTFE
jgi:hypothetical protein